MILVQRAVLAAVAVSSLMSGCMSLSVGGSDYACQGMPEGVRCMSARDVYTATNNADHIGPTDRKIDKKPTADEAKTMTGAFPRGVEDLTPITQAAVPVRSPAKVMRTWVAPWEDDNGHLHASEFVFSEIQGRTWSIGNQTFGDGIMSKPLKTGSPVQGRDRNVSPLRGTSGSQGGRR